MDFYEGLADIYDAYRPKTPEIILDILTRLSDSGTPRLVVDLGCGTGLSTFVWRKRAKEVVGVEQNDDMRRVAESRKNTMADAGNVRFHHGSSSSTGLADGSADIVTCSQSFHWMEPKTTLAEIARVLRNGGVFAAYDYSRIPIVGWEMEAAFRTFWERVSAARKSLGAITKPRWDKSEHLGNIETSGLFRYSREFHVHSVEQGSAERVVGYILSFSVAGALVRKHGLGDSDLGLDTLRADAERLLGTEPKPWVFSYTVRIGVK